MTEHSSTPFGNPDGARADISQIRDGFVEFVDAGVWGGIATPKDDFTARVIVGRKGSGKTVYLRRIQDAAAQEDSIYSDDIQQNLPTTDQIVKFSQWFGKNELTEKWRELWRRAILRSVYTHLFNSPSLRDNISAEVQEKLPKEFAKILPSTSNPRSIYSQVRELVSYLHSKREFDAYCDRPEWEDLEYQLADIMRHQPPLFFFMDAVDEEFAHAPMYWLQCQKGLFYQVMRFLRDARIGSRLHVFICIRDIVLTSIFRSEHQSRYRNEPHIRILRWDADSILRLLIRKVRSLPTEYCYGQDSNVRSIPDWLGVESLWNESRQVRESIEKYILRHSRLLPRDIVMLGNQLASSIVHSRELHENRSAEEIVRHVVHKCTHVFADEQIQICANQIASDTMPERAHQFDYSSLFTGDQEYSRGLSDEIIRFLKLIDSDRFSYSDMIDVEEMFSIRIGVERSNLFSVLWQNGLIGYCEDDCRPDEFIFYSEDHLDNFSLPTEMPCYSFHSVLSDAVRPTRVHKPAH